MSFDPHLRRLLGLSDGLTRLTAYDLLGVPQGTHSPETIRAALSERRKQLRRQVRDGRQIPLVRRAERQLDRAAGLLLDPVQRAAYDARLRDEAERPDCDEQAQVAEAACRVVEEAIDEDGGLEDAARPALAGRLRQLGVPDHDVETTLAGIPAPTLRVSAEERRAFFEETVELNIARGILPPENEHALLGLARTLDLRAEQAQSIIEDRLRAVGAERGASGEDVLRAQLVREARDLFLDGRTSVSDLADLLDLAVARGLSQDEANSIIQETIEACRLEAGGFAVDAGRPAQVGDADGIGVGQSGLGGVGSVAARQAPSTPRADRAAWRWRLVAAAAVLAVVTAIIVLSQYHGRQEARATRATSTAPSTSQRLASATGPTTAARPSTTAPPVRPNPPATSASPTTQRTGAPPPPPPKTSTPTRPPTVRDQLDQLRRGELRYSSSTLHEELLADVALTMLACRDRVIAFAQRRDFVSGELTDAVDADKRVEFFASKVTLPRAARAPSPKHNGLPAMRLEQLRKELQSSARSTRYAAVESLRVADSLAAAEALLQRLARATRMSSASFQQRPQEVPLASRVLRALETMGDPNIPRRLIGLMARASNNILTFQLDRSLDKILEHRVGEDVFRQVADGYREMRATTRRQTGAAERRAKANAWTATLKRIESYEARQGGGASSGRTPPAGASTPAASPQGRQPTRTRLRLLVAAAHYAKQTADALDACTWPAPSPAASPRPGAAAASIPAPADISTDLLRSLDRIVRRLDSLVKARPEAKQRAAAIDRIHQDRRARTLASRTALQRAVVDLDTAACLLELLARTLDRNGKAQKELDEIHDERVKASMAPTTVIEEMRESSFFNCFLWWRVFQLAEGTR